MRTSSAKPSPSLFDDKHVNRCFQLVRDLSGLGAISRANSLDKKVKGQER